ncbi:hypothetical protein SMD44_p10232 (plasmid) [Streptomyces alboflavus]|uniref:Uncharacterized protein n=1 Tax=Streptomyces alboflavus TaxID=67267 RepID=A0A291W520_9ACTN|nr:hypothetical protein [Streptomyces alboflavus]ATM24731.1 hypothetical protein SMD44_p10232 [Streptomyces alboflavus]
MTRRRIDRAGIKARYGVKDASAFTRLVNFPASDEDGLWDVTQVDAWVQAMRPQFWPPRPEAAAASATAAPVAKAKPKKAATAKSSGAKTAPGTETAKEMAGRFRVSIKTPHTWARTKEQRGPDGRIQVAAFPQPASPGRWKVRQVDNWVRLYRPRVWAAYSGDEPRYVIPLPEGHPKDLLDIGEYGVIRGNALSGQPALRATMQYYLRNDLIAAPDRIAGDGEQPEVFEPMWYRETIYSEIRKRRTREAVEVGEKPVSRFLRQYFEEHSGLLNLERIAQLDGLEHNRAPTSLTTLKAYQSEGKLAPPDRRPGDGQEPPVEDLMWKPESVLPFLCRPDLRRRAVAGGIDGGRESADQ